MKLNIGCGKRNFGEDWIHIDGSNYSHIHSHDIINLPFPDNSIDLIYSSHTFEYFDREEAYNVLLKWKSKLKDGAILRLAVPNFEMYNKLYYEGKITLDQCVGPLYGKWQMTETQNVYHKTTYDYISLKTLLEKAKLKNIKIWNWKKVDHGIYDDYSQSFIPHMDKKNGILMSLNIECNK
jgi:predicted SAM-dependent methyltransferase